MKRLGVAEQVVIVVPTPPARHTSGTAQPTFDVSK